MVTLTALVLVTATRSQQPGNLDTNFGDGGLVRTPSSVEFTFPQDMEIQSDGKIVSCGHRYPIAPSDDAEIVLGRYLANGQPDPSFGDGGRVYTRISSGGGSYGVALALQSDGRIVVLAVDSMAQVEKIYILRYLTDGSVDQEFGIEGRIQVTSLAGNRDVAIQSDGKIIAAGEVPGDPPFNRRFALARYQSNGSIDSSFGDQGVVSTGFQTFSYLAAIRVQSDGKIVAAGQSVDGSGVPHPIVVLARYNDNGSLDQSFGNLGRVMTQYPDCYPADLAIGPENVLVVSGKQWVPAGYRGLVLRYTSGGALDTSFGGSGIVVQDHVSQFDSVAVQPNRKVIAGGLDISGLHTAIRFTDNGSADRVFGQAGTVLMEFPDILPPTPNTQPSWGTVNAIRIQTDGKIVASGYWLSQDVFFNLLWAYPAIARYYGDAVATGHAPFDFDGDGKSDIGVFRPSVADWWIDRSSDGSTFTAQFGATTDVITPGDFTGDGKTDIPVWRPGSGEWFVLRSEDFSYYSFPFGSNGDTPVPSDYDNDGKADNAVFRSSNSTWFVLRSSDGGTTIETFGSIGDVPVPADYDGDGKTDIAIYRPTSGQWWIDRSSAGVIAVNFGNATDTPVVGDYTGDGKADVAFWRPSTGEWFVLRSEDFSFYSFPFGLSSDIPAPGDYDGDGRFDATVFRGSNGTWYSQRSTAGILVQQFGVGGDRPIPNAFIP